MNKYNDLELSVLSCLILKPELMEQIKFEDKHIIKHNRLWQFMKAFYKKFGNFDPALMFDMCSNNWKLVMYIERLADLELSPNHFEEYQQRLIESYEELKKDKWIINKVYNLTNDLYTRNIKVDEFRDKVDKIYEDADRLYKDGE